MSKKPNEQDTQLLRAVAEAQLAHEPQTKGPSHPAVLLHELHVHQIELEMQNETLRQAQVALEESRDRYVDLYEFAPVGYLTLTDAGLISEMNLTGAALLGVERNKLLQRRFAQFIVAGDRDRWHRFSSQVLHQTEPGKNKNCELQLIGAGGMDFTAYLDCRYMKSGSGEPTMRVILADVSHMREAEEAMCEWQAFVESAAWGMTIGDMESRMIRLANPAYARMHGYTVEELRNIKADVMYAPESRARLSHYVECLRKDRHITFECERQRKDGSTFPAVVDIAIVEGRGGSTTMVSVRDVSEIKRTQTEILQIKNQLQATLNAIPDLLFELDMDGRYLDIHYSRHELLAAPAEVLLGKTVHDVLPPEAADGVISALREAHEEGMSYGSQIKLPLPQGDTWFELSASRKSNDPGQKPSFIMLSRDISERKKLENELVESRKLLRELAEKTESLREEERKRIAREVHDELGQILTALRMDVALINLRFGGQNAELLSKTEGMSALLDRAGWCVRDIVSNLRPTALDIGIVAAMR